MFSSLDSLLFFFILASGVIKFLLGHHLGKNAEMIGILAPSGESFLFICMSEHIPEVVHDAHGIFIQEIFSCSHSNALEHLNSQCSSSDRTNNVDSIAFFTNILTPSVQDVASFLNVHIILNVVDMSFKGILESTVHMLFLGSCIPELVSKSATF